MSEFDHLIHDGVVVDNCSYCDKPLGGGSVNGLHAECLDTHMNEVRKIEADEFQHLGDGVYAKFDGHGVGIHVNDHRNPQAVYLELDVIRRLVKMVEPKNGNDG